jgi:hypothetical protein
MESWSAGVLEFCKQTHTPILRLSVVNDLAFRLENGLLKLVECLERKQETGDWIDSLIIKESNVAYG